MFDFAAARETMVDTQVRPSDVTKYPIIDALLAVPREEFVPADSRPVAYVGEHIPLSDGRVLLDPRVFGKMLDAVAVGPADLVLDIGSGYGYSAAVLSRLGEAVIAVEEDEAMAAEAESRLSRLGFDTAVVERGPLAEGQARHGPFDVVVVEGAVETVPAEIAEQVKPGGRVVAIFADGERGEARLGLRTRTGIAWQRLFDATAPVLPGFSAEKPFEF